MVFNHNVVNKQLRDLLRYNILSIVISIFLFILPFYWYIKDGEILINFIFVIVSVLNVIFIFISYKISKKIKFKKQQIRHFKQKEKNENI